jgi:hypothetical protein
VLKYGFALALVVELVLVGRALVALARDKAAPAVQVPLAPEE